MIKRVSARRLLLFCVFDFQVLHRRIRRISSFRGHERTDSPFGALLPLCHIFLHLLQFLLEPGPKHINIVSRSIVDTPPEQAEQKRRARPAVPEPDRTGQHTPEGVQVLGQHEGGLLQHFGKAQDEFAYPGLTIRFSKPGEGGRAARGDLLAAADGDEKVVAELPDGVGDG